ncbi:MAG: hypothetical protein ACE5E4_10060, partial [Candidatus Binatia bacterium]
MTPGAVPRTAFILLVAWAWTAPAELYAVCGDGTIEQPAEQCDDGNVGDGDGCDATCQIESCFVCVAEPSLCSPDDAASCDDGNPCTVGSCSEGSCIGVPAAVVGGCHQALKSRLTLKDKSDDAKDRLAWKWQKGEATSEAEFGDPTATTAYTLCLYDFYPAVSVASVQVPAAGTCGDNPCWQGLGSPPGRKGFKYRDKQRPLTTGIGSIRLTPGSAGRARVKVKGNGSNLGLPTLPHDLPLDVQLRADNGECWESVFYPPGVRKNSAGRFKGKAADQISDPWPQLLDGYPQTLISMRFTRQLHDDHPELSYEDLVQIYGGFHGLIPPSNHFDDYTRFRREHPEKIANWFHEASPFSDGQTKYDIIDREQFFAGHWTYYENSLITADVVAENGVTEIAVARPDLFFIQQVGPGGWKYVEDDIALCAVGPGGLPDWNLCEQVGLESVDHVGGTIRVHRGLYGTTPLELMAGQAVAAAHAMYPWGADEKGSPGGSWSWLINFATDGPKDSSGRSAVDILYDQMAPMMQPGGALEVYDGIGLDVLVTRPNERSTGRVADTDGDGAPDGGMRGTVNVFELGAYEFVRRLGEAWPDKVLVCDGAGDRFIGVCNGIETEWWPGWGDVSFEGWSTGLNVSSFWAQNAGRSPAFSDVNHWIGGGAGAGVPHSASRLVFAGAVFTDSVVTSMFLPAAEPGEVIGAWDEWRRGTDHQIGWLGQPLGPPIRLAAEQPDLLGGVGQVMDPSILGFVTGDQIDFAVSGGVLHVTPQLAEPEFFVSPIAFAGGDLYVRFKISADKLPEHAALDIARGLSVSVVSGSSEQLSLAHVDSFEAGFYFRDVVADGGSIALKIALLGEAPVHISDFTVHSYPDVVAREFEHGLVLANPSNSDFTFDINALTPGRSYRRLQGSPEQAPEFNDGSLLGPTLALGPLDAAFLLATDRKGVKSRLATC